MILCSFYDARAARLRDIDGVLPYNSRQAMKTVSRGNARILAGMIVLALLRFRFVARDFAAPGLGIRSGAIGIVAALGSRHLPLIIYSKNIKS